MRQASATGACCARARLVVVICTVSVSPSTEGAQVGPCEFSGRPTRGNSRIEGTRPVRSGLPPPPSSPANLDREETRAGFPYSFRGFCRSRRTARRAGRAHRATLSVPVSSLDFRGERLRRRLPSGASLGLPGRYGDCPPGNGRLESIERAVRTCSLRGSACAGSKAKSPPPGGNRGTSRPHLALRGTTRHYVAQDRPLHVVVGGCALSSEGCAFLV